MKKAILNSCLLLYSIETGPNEPGIKREGTIFSILPAKLSFNLILSKGMR